MAPSSPHTGAMTLSFLPARLTSGNIRQEPTLPTRHEPEERRKNSGLSDEEIDAIKDRILASVYEDIGRSLVKKILWALGAVFAALLTWLGANGYFK